MAEVIDDAQIGSVYRLTKRVKPKDRKACIQRFISDGLHAAMWQVINNPDFLSVFKASTGIIKPEDVQEAIKTAITNSLG